VQVLVLSAVLTQVPAEQTSSVQSLASVQVLVLSAVLTQVPAEQTSSVQGLESVQVFVSSLVFWQLAVPVVLLMMQASSVQALESLQLMQGKPRLPQYLAVTGSAHWGRPPSNEYQQPVHSAKRGTHRAW
jgi:hypothetical protein